MEDKQELEFLQDILSGKPKGLQSPYVKDIFKLYDVEMFLKKNNKSVPRILTRIRLEIEKAQKNWEKEMDSMFK